MNKKALLLITSVIILAGTLPAQINENPKFIGREKSFFGLHFDFHAVNSDSAIGKTFDAGTIDSMLTLIKPDYIQVDCKGHPGISSYPTKVGNPAPGFVKDPYEIWRRVTAKHGVGLFVHYSGIIDFEAVKKHPEWGVLDKEGKIIEGKNSVRGPYVDKLLIPQLKELTDNYKIDGAWVDGESWALELDYSKYMLDAFRNETGIKTVPRGSADPGWQEFRDFNRDSFRKYMAHYVDELHKYAPGFQLTSNWAFSSFIPRPVDVNIDFISGDFEPNNSLYSGLFESRCMAPQGKPWDLMVWSFAHDDNGCYVYKSLTQLKQAAAVVISMGGGFQIYSTQNRDASVKPWLFKNLQSVGNFCRERQPFCQYAKPVPQIAMLYSTENYSKNSEPLYSASGKIHDPIRGMLNLLLDSQNAVEILMEHHFEKRISEYPLVVIPEVESLTENFKKTLLEYVNAGGNLLVIGAEAAKMFAPQLGVQMKDSAFYCVRNLGWDGHMAGVRGLYQPVIPESGTETTGFLYPEPDFRFQASPAATIASYGKGKIAGVYFSLGRFYLKMKSPVYKNFINAIVRRLFPSPIVEVKGSDDVVVTVNRVNNSLAVNLINLSGPHQNIRVSCYDKIPAPGPLDVKIRYASQPEEVTLQPGNIPLKYSYKDGEITTVIDKLEIHSIIVIR